MQTDARTSNTMDSVQAKTQVAGIQSFMGAMLSNTCRWPLQVNTRYDWGMHDLRKKAPEHEIKDLCSKNTWVSRLQKALAEADYRGYCKGLVETVSCDSRALGILLREAGMILLICWNS